MEGNKKNGNQFGKKPNSTAKPILKESTNTPAVIPSKNLCLSQTQGKENSPIIPQANAAATSIHHPPRTSLSTSSPSHLTPHLNDNPLFSPDLPPNPPEKILCVGLQMMEPYMGITAPLIQKLKVEIHSWMMSSWVLPELLITLKLPNDVNQAFRYLSDAFKSAYPNSSSLMDSNHNLCSIPIP